VCYPGEEKHTRLAEGSEDGRLQLLTYFAKHARIRGLILELRNKSISARHDTIERTGYVQAELAKWSNEIHDAVEDDLGMTNFLDDDDPSTLSSSHRLTLLMAKYESTICLNRPMMSSDPSHPAYSAALQNCIFAAKSIFLALKKHQHRNKTAEDPSGLRLLEPMVWPSFTWSIWISAFILVYAACEQQLPLESALK
jgi:hypothetical protein